MSDIDTRQPAFFSHDEAPRQQHAAAAEHQAAAARLWKSDKSYQYMVEHSQGLICLHDLHGTILWVNRAATQALGYAPEESLVGSNLRQFLHPTVRHEFDKYLQHIRRHTTDSGLMRMITKNGEERVWKYQNTRCDEAGKSPYVIGYAQDITAHMRTEAALKRAHDTLEQRVVERTAELQHTNERLQAEITERRRAEQALAKRIKQVEALRTITAEITRELDLTTVLELINQRAVELVEAATSGAVYLFDAVTNVLTPQAWYGRGAWMREVRLVPGQGLVGNVVERRQGLLVNDYPTSQFATPLFVERLGCTAVVAEPLLYREQLVGAIALSNEGTKQPFTVHDRGLLSLFAAQAVVAIENARLYEAVLGTRDFLQSIAENSVDAIVTTDVAGRITYWTPGAEELLGYRAQEVLGRTWADFYRGGLQEARALMRRLKTAGRIRNYETVLQTRSGQQINVSSSLSLLRDTSGAMVGTLGIIKNITDRKRAEQERLKLEQQLQQAQKLESLSVLAGGVAHDFNNLLTGILSNAAIAQRTLASDHVAQQHLRETVQGAKLAAHLTGQLLAYAGKGQFHIRPVDLSAEVQEVEALLKTAVRGKARLLFDLSPKLPAIEADPVQIHQLLMNLTINAAESLPEEVTIDIKTATSDMSPAALRHLVLGNTMHEGRYVVLEVRDNGCGMDETIRQRVFDPFFTTKTTGHGLGLAATLGIVHSHGGGIQLVSSPGAGTTFRLFFPATEKEVEARREEPPHDLTGHGVILVVDDDEYVLQAVAVVLQSFGYTVLLADNGRKAIDMMRTRGEDIALVILDMIMPSMSGEETFRALRALSPQMKVLFSTAYEESETLRLFTVDGLTGFLRKPYDPDQLAAKVKQLLGDTSQLSLFLEGEPEFQALRAAYRQRLPGRLTELVAALRLAQTQPESDAALQDARRLAHTLKGTVGSYGFDAIATVLRHIEETLDKMQQGEITQDTDVWAHMEATLTQAQASLAPDIAGGDVRV